MTAESPQPAAADTPTPSAQSGATGQQAGNQQLRIALLVVVAAVVGVGLWLAFGHSSKNKKKQGGSPAVTTAIGPVALSERQLRDKNTIINQPMYWAGPKQGYHYEFWRLKSDRIFVRYLPQNVKAGAPGAHYLIVGTYPLPGAYGALKKLANGKGVSGPNGSLVWVRPGYPKSVYIVWPKVNYEVEVYNPNPSKALQIAKSTQIQTVG